MILQHIYIARADWDVWVYYAVDAYYTDEIMARLADIGCPPRYRREAHRNLSAGQLDSGLTYSNLHTHESVVVISITSSPEEFADSFDHEKGHLLRHISQSLSIDPHSEEEQYIAGEIARKLHPAAKHFLCHHCRNSLRTLRGKWM